MGNSPGNRQSDRSWAVGVHRVCPGSNCCCGDLGNGIQPVYRCAAGEQLKRFFLRANGKPDKTCVHCWWHSPGFQVI